MKFGNFCPSDLLRLNGFVFDLFAAAILLCPLLVVLVCGEHLWFLVLELFLRVFDEEFTFASCSWVSRKKLLACLKPWVSKGVTQFFIRSADPVSIDIMLTQVSAEPTAGARLIRVKADAPTSAIPDVV